jgi:hypothetical protein
MINNLINLMDIKLFLFSISVWLRNKCRQRRTFDVLAYLRDSVPGGS